MSFATGPNISSHCTPQFNLHPLHGTKPPTISNRISQCICLSAEIDPPPRGLRQLLRRRHHGFLRARFTYYADTECVRITLRLRARSSFG